MKRRWMSILLSLVMMVSLVPAFTCTAEATQSVVSRDDGVWLYPLDSQYWNTFSDWAGCNEGNYYDKNHDASVGICPFHNVHHYGCGANHTTYDGFGHNGFDTGANKSGAKIYAAAPGTVRYVDSNGNSARGLFVVIEHSIGNGYSYYSVYQHCSSVTVSVGTSVSAGTIIGYVGSSGYITGPHLHFGILMGPSNFTKTVDQMEGGGWITAPGYKTGRIVNNPASTSPIVEDSSITVPLIDGYSTSLRDHCGSTHYTFDKSKVSIGAPGESGYLSQCTKEYSFCQVKTTEDTNMNTLPCSSQTSQETELVVKVPYGTTLIATAIYKNTADNYWYKVTYAGKSGYVWAGHTNLITTLTDVSIENEQSPSNISVGSYFSIGGTLSSTKNYFCTVAGYIFPDGVEKAYGNEVYYKWDSVSNNSYNLYGSPIDYAMLFNNLSAGTYYYYIEAHVKIYYSNDGVTLETKDRYPTIVNKRFTVGAATDPGSHTHDKGVYVYFEGAHPHRDCYKCSICGTIWADEDSSGFYESCTTCNLPGKPSFKGLQETYTYGAPVIFEWDETERTTHYNFWLSRENNDGTWTAVNHTYYVESSFSLSLEPGNYRALLQSYNSNMWFEDHSDWLYTESDYVYFTVLPATYTVTYDANGGSGAPEEQIKYHDQPLTLSSMIPVRTGYSFIGWATRADAAEPEYQPGDIYENNSDVVLYALWRQQLIITTQPTDFTGLLNSNAIFTVAAQGEGLTYKWQTNAGGSWADVDFAANNAATLTVKITLERDGTQYRCVITDVGGQTVTSNAATLHAQVPAPVITTQPTDFTGLLNSNAIFTVAAQGEGLTYKWQTNAGGSWADVDFAANNAATLTVKITLERDGTQYRCVVTDVAGQTVTSNAATLHAQVPAPVITTQPKDFTGALNDFAAFTVAAQGEGLTYKWQSNTTGKWTNTSFASSTEPTLSVKITSARDGKQFRCVITDAAGQTVTSNAATLHAVTPGPTITSQPKDFTGALNDFATFTVAAQGEGLTYKWQSNTTGKWTNTSFASSTKPTLSVKITAARDGKQFRCVITDATGQTVTSNAATLHAQVPAPVITTQPEDFTGALNDFATFTVAAQGEGLTYKWQSNTTGKWTNTSFASSTEPTLSVKITAARDGKQFRCVITDATGQTVTSDAATLHVETPALRITSQPKDFTGALNDFATFTVAAQGEGLTYKWQSNTTGKWTNTSFASSTEPTLSVKITSARDGKQFRCVITDATGNTVTSNAATLHVATTTGVAINAANFPDDVFRSLVAERYDKDGDGVLSEAEIAAVTSVSCSSKGIASLRGVEYFTAMNELYCEANQLTELDVSECAALTYLSCYGNQLRTLNVSANTALWRLDCYNNQLTNLDLSANTALTALYCSGNHLTSLDLNSNTSLKNLSCSNNQLTSLDVSHNTALSNLWCSYNRLTTLDISHTVLNVLHCENNQLTTLDIRDCSDLVDAYLNGERTEDSGWVSYILNYKKLYVDTNVTIVAS